MMFRGRWSLKSDNDLVYSYCPQLPSKSKNTNEKSEAKEEPPKEERGFDSDCLLPEEPRYIVFSFISLRVISLVKRQKRKKFMDQKTIAAVTMNVFFQKNPGI